MSKRDSNETTDVATTTGVPAYLAEYGSDSLDTLKDLQQYRVLARLKTVQPTAGGNLLDAFKAGDVILSGVGSQLYSKTSELPFQFVALGFFKEFCKWSDLKDESSPTIIESSYDEKSLLAQKCRDKEQRTEVYEGQEAMPPDKQLKYRYVEHLNFPIIIYNSEFEDVKGETAMLTFIKGEFTTGKQFINKMMMRAKSYPLWSLVWEADTGFRNPSPDKKWHGIDPETPIESTERLIKEDEVEHFRTAWTEIKELIAGHSIGTEFEDDDEATVVDDGTM